MNAKEHAKREFEAFRRDDAAALALLDKAAEENRDNLTAEEQEQYDKLFASAREHKRISEDLIAGEAEARRIQAIVEAAGGDPEPSDSGEPIGDQPSSLRTQLVNALLDQQRHVHAGGDKRREIEIEAETRAIADFSDADALYVDEFATAVAVYQRTMSPWLTAATVRVSPNGRPLIVPNLTTDVTGYTPGEGTAITESTPTFGTAQISLTSYKALAYVSMEADEDAMYDVMPYISRSQGRSLGLQQGSAITTAVLTAATNGGTAGGLGGGGTAAFIGYEDLLDLKYGRPAPYRAAGAWVMANGMIKKARKFTDKNGQYLWQPAIAAGQPDRFDGQPVYEDPFLADPGSATKSALYGDLSAVLVKTVALRFAVSTEFRFSNDQLALKAVVRSAGTLPDANAVAYIVSKNS